MNNRSQLYKKIESIKNKLMSAFRKRCLKEDMGFQDEGSNGRWDIPWTDIIRRMDVSYVTEDNEVCDIDNAYYAKIEVGAELDYSGMSKISEVGDKVLYQYDKDAYFDMEAPGRMSAFVNLNTLSGVNGSVDVEAADNGSDFSEKIPAENLTEMSKQELHDFLENLPVGTEITGIVDAPGTFGRRKYGTMETRVRKAGGYTGPYYNRFGLPPSDTKYQDTWWELSGSKTHSWEIVSIIQGKNKYYSVLALEDSEDSVESSSDIQATVDYIVDPTERLPEGRSVSPESDEYDAEGEIDLKIDAIIDIDSNGDWEYDDTTYPWAKSNLNRQGDWYINTDYGDVYVGDAVDIVEKVDELLEAFLPMKNGRFYITGDANLFFDISNIPEISYFGGRDEDSDFTVDSEHYLDDAEVEFNFNKSKITNFNIEEIR